jgi:3-hydroxyacyl-[acyl-carrier-protein] dehydratase
MELELQISAPLEHPSYAGHFPGHPIVPGVLLLDLVASALGRGAPRTVNSVKFHRAVQPGESFTLRYRVTGAQLSFRCLAGDQLLAEGSLTFAP